MFKKFQNCNGQKWFDYNNTFLQKFKHNKTT